MVRKVAGPDTQESGFTLVELLVVCVLLGLLAAILYGTITGILQGRAIIESERQTQQIAQYVFERMGRELAGRSLTGLSEPSDKQQSTTQQTSPFAGLGQQTGGSGRSYFVGSNAKESSSDRDRMRFVSANGSQQLFGKLPNYGLVELDYRLEEPEDRTEQPKDGFPNLLLVRGEVPAEVTDKDVVEKRSATLVLADDVVSLNFRYMKDGKWQDEWAEQFTRLPEAVEVTLRLRASEDHIETYRTAFGVSRPVRRPQL